MTDLDRYRQSTEHCARKAAAAANRELRELWLTIQGTYQFLVDREERTGRVAAAVQNQGREPDERD